MRIIWSLGSSTPVDLHQVHDTGKWVDPIADGREWSTFRYTSRGRVGRGGRIIFVRTMVTDRLDEDPKCGVEPLDFNVVSPQSIKIWSGDSVCSHVLRHKRTFDEMEGIKEFPPVTSAS